MSEERPPEQSRPDDPRPHDSLRLLCPHCGKKLRVPNCSVEGKKVRCPACQQPFVATFGAVPPPQPIAAPPVASPVVSTPVAPPTESVTSVQSELSAHDQIQPGQIQIVVTPPTARRSGKPRSKRSGKSSWLWGAIVGGSLAIGVAIIVYFLVYQPSIPIQKTVVSAPPPAAPASPDVANVPTGPETPITLRHLPGGVRLLVYLRPYDLFQGGHGSQELLQLAGASGTWFAQQVRTQTFAELSELDELLLGWILGAPGEPPKFVCRFQRRPELTEELLASRLGDDFQPGTGGAWRQSASTAIWLIDQSTVVIVPIDLSGEVAEAATTPLPTDLGVEEVLQRSSVNDQLLIAGVPYDLETHRALLADPCFQNGWDALRTILEQEHRHAEAFSLAVRWNSAGTALTLHIKSSNTAKMNNVRAVIESRLAELPGLAQQGTVSDHLAPGFLSIARRFPSMLKVIQESASYEIAGRQVVVRSQLPERALPNLLLAGLLLWHNQSASSTTPAEPTVESKPEPTSPPTESKPQSVAELLQKRIDVDFRREPLEGALKTISDEIGSPIEIDGDALKLAGYTRNMPQTLQLEQFPAGGILQKILVQYDQMVLAIIDGSPETLLLTTKDGAAQKRLKTLTLELQAPASNK